MTGLQPYLCYYIDVPRQIIVIEVRRQQPRTPWIGRLWRWFRHLYFDLLGKSCRCKCTVEKNVDLFNRRALRGSWRANSETGLHSFCAVCFLSVCPQVNFFFWYLFLLFFLRRHHQSALCNIWSGFRDTWRQWSASRYFCIACLLLVFQESIRSFAVSIGLIKASVLFFCYLSNQQKRRKEVTADLLSKVLNSACW